MKKNYILLIILILLSTACGSTKSGSNSIMTFFAGQGSIQYFVKPFELESKEEGAVSLDFTYRHHKDSTKKVTFNFTISNTLEPIYTIDSAYFKLENGVIISVEDLSILFREIEKKEIRYTSKISFTQFESLFDTSKYIFIIHSKSKILEYLETNDSEEARNIIKREILEPIRNE